MKKMGTKMTTFETPEIPMKHSILRHHPVLPEPKLSRSTTLMYYSVRGNIMDHGEEGVRYDVYRD